MLVGAYGGLRIGELAGLRRRRIDVLRRTVEVREIAVEVRGAVRFGPPKTAASLRTIALPRFVVSELENHLGRYTAADADALVFPGPSGGVLRPPAWRRRVWRPACEEAGLEGLRPHDLRHTAVALWIAAGASPKEIAVRAGHRSVVTVLDVYGHLLPGTDEALADRLDDLYAQGEPKPPPARIAALRTQGSVP